MSRVDFGRNGEHSINGNRIQSEDIVRTILKNID